MKQEQGFAVSFTGHREKKLPQGAELEKIRQWLHAEIEAAISDGADVFYSGLANGIDCMGAEYVLEMKKTHPQLMLIGVSPYRDEISRRHGDDLTQYEALLRQADSVIFLQEHYSRDCFAKRNKYLVEHCSRLIAVAAEGKSGSAQTIRMAQKANIEIRRYLVSPQTEPDQT